MWHLMCIQVWRAYWWLFCFGCCLQRVTCGSHDNTCRMSGSAGIAIWRARLFAAHLRVGAWSSQTYNLCWDEISFIVKLNWVIHLYYTTGNLSDIDHNANNEANGPFKWIYVIIRTDFCWIRVYIIIGLRKVIASPYKPDWGRSPVWPCEVYWILLIMLNMRRMDLSCAYM